jgi:carbohydrate-binding DOMON domain-containing protein
MKHFLLLVLIPVILLQTGCSGKTDEKRDGGFVSRTPQHMVFSYRDSLFDDRGTGRYIYPVPLQSQKDGIFDLKAFNVRDKGDMYEFEMEFRRPIDRETVDGSSSANGWAYQLIDIYVDQDGIDGSGLTKSLPGRNVEFNSKEAWDKVIVVTPGNSAAIEKTLTENSEYRELHRFRKNILVPSHVYLKNYSIFARIPKARLGGNPQSWGFQVCVMGYDKYNVKRNGLFNMEVVTFATEEKFGGGTDYDGNTNVIDILSPDKNSQYKVLSSFVSSPYASENLPAIVPMIYRIDKQNVPKNRQKSMSRSKQSQYNTIEERYQAPVKE